MRNLVVALASGLGLGAGHVGSAAAQDVDLFARDRNVAVSQRPRPELQALGLRLGSFMAYPKLQGDIGYDSNVVAADVDERSDTLFRLSPSVDVESGWSRHSLSGFARAAITRYSEYSQESNETWAVGTAGRLDVQRWTAVQGGLEYARQVEPRTSSSAPQSIAEPIEFDSLLANLGATRTFNRLRASGRFDVRTYDYKDGISVAGSVIEQDDRDQTTFEGTGRLDYAVSPATALFGRVTVNSRQYDDTGSSLTPNRDSEGINAILGANFELTNLVRGEAGLGYLQQTFDDSRYGELSGLSANARLEYFATPLLTLGLTADRSVGDSGVIGSAGFLATTLQVTADYEFRRNVLVAARLGHANEEFDAVDRENGRWFGTVRATYLMNRRLGLTASYDFEKRNSEGLQAINDFTANRFLVSLVAQY